MVREVLTVNVGGAGVNLGEAVTKQYMAEHHIDGKGNLGEDGGDKQFTFFAEKKRGLYTPRSLSVDLDPSSIDALSDTPMDGSFDHDFLLSGKEDAANIFARGHYSVGKTMMDAIDDKIRKMADNSDNFQGFIMNHSLGGGTGSGLGTLILEHLAVDYQKKSKVGFEVIGGNGAYKNTPCQSYNEMLATHWLVDHTDVIFLFDNSKVNNICKSLGVGLQPSYDHVNSLIAKTVSGITSTLRFDQNVALNDFQTNMVPFPRQHFMTSSTVGLKIRRSTAIDQEHLREKACKAFEPSYFNLSFPAGFDVVHDKYMAIGMHWRGRAKEDVKRLHYICDFLKIKNKVNFYEWLPTGFSVGWTVPTETSLSNGDVFEVEETSLTMFGNNSAIGRVFTKNAKKCDMMWSQKAYVHTYVGAGMEHQKFLDAREDIGFLEEEYLSLASKGASDEDEE